MEGALHGVVEQAVQVAGVAACHAGCSCTPDRLAFFFYFWLNFHMTIKKKQNSKQIVANIDINKIKRIIQRN